MPHPTASPVPVAAPTSAPVPASPVAVDAPLWADPVYTWGDAGAMWDGWAPTGGTAVVIED